MRISHWLAGALALASTQIAHADARADLTVFTRGLKSLQGGFSQEVYDTKGHLKQSSSGRVSLATPRQFRWEYVKPYRQLVIADGKTVWIYEPDLQQVSKRPQGPEEQNSPLAILVDPARLDHDYIVTDGGTSAGMNWLGIAPRSKADSNFQSARIGFKDGQLSQIVVTDPLGQRTQMYFALWQRNLALPATTFGFTVPKGVDVIGD
ncbi:outer membrane lipoprotein chaperone LolA [Solilutibacter silvestris]|uniref:Outer-membrane lipoprotein carrier protein n=1 Tax=Solilutibacter silvestris TaxID=1645665 RepID=A0A2K1PZA8_9GAMM|nr:outer membrane lipoprotein chaperone LolA [Lysobacter silvestris]PNS08123.1 lolA: outer membrane lipoprotein carrier protein LolA [Lysobacter silvestris]